MRAAIVAFLSGLALAAGAVQAAPNSPVKAPAAELGAAAPIELVNDGCGHGCGERAHAPMKLIGGSK